MTATNPAGFPNGLPVARQDQGRAAQAQAVPERRFSFVRIVIALWIAAVLALLAGLGGRPSAIAYTVLSVGTGALLLSRSPIAYVQFSLWLWFVTPFVRRVLDFRHGWSPVSAALLAPLVVALLSIFQLSRHTRELRGIMYAPFLLVLAALGYGYMVGVLTAGFIPASYALATWLAPASFGVYLSISWRRYPQLSASIRRTFAVALPLLAAYGVYQFARLPAWDAKWMRDAQLGSIGAPLPFLLRIFSTLNTPGPFAAFLATGMLILIPSKGWWRYPALAIAVVALLLTRTRAVWIAFVIGVLVEQLGQPVIRLPKRAIALVVVLVMALPLAATPQFRTSILPRLSTLMNIRADRSFITRVEFSQEVATSIVETAEGAGLGMTGGAIKLRGGQGIRSLDNGFLEIFYLFGWPGGSLFFLGIGGLLLQSFRFIDARRDQFANSARACMVALVSVLSIGDVFTGPTGTLLWSMIGMSIGAHAYHLTTGLALRSRASPENRLAPATRRAALAPIGEVSLPTAMPSR